MNLTRKTVFLRGGVGSSPFNNLGLALGTNLQLGKRIKTESQQVLGANSYVCRSYRGKTGRGGGGGGGVFWPPHLE